MQEETLEYVLFGNKELNEHDEDYMNYLTSCPINKLTKEPDTLLFELENVQEEMKSTVVKDYRSFVKASQCIHQLHSSVDQLTTSLKDLSHSINPLPSSCNNFIEESSSLLEDRNKNKLTIDKYDKIIDLLKLPTLMERRIKQKSYEDVLQLQQFSKQLLKKYPNTPIINSIANDVDIQVHIMRDQLHKCLKGNIKVHECLESISFLRRLEMYSDTELRVIFLKSRDSWFYSQKELLSTKNAYSYLSKLIDLTRDHLYEVITQYRIIFSDTTKQSNDKDGRLDSSILSSWMVYRVNSFISELEIFLSRINEGASIRNLMDLSISISRVGVDISGYLPSIFELHVQSIFSNIITNATDIFCESIKSDNIISVAKARNPLLIERRESLAPNRILLEVPSLAILTNTFLNGFNELRQCAIITIRSNLSNILSTQLERIVTVIKEQKSTCKTSRQPEFSKLAEITSDHFLPYIEKCFNHIYQSQTTLIDITNFTEILSTLYDKKQKLITTNN